MPRASGEPPIPFDEEPPEDEHPPDDPYFYRFR
jgi:hypothetical protein